MKIFKTSLFAIAVLLCSLANAHDFEVGGIYYNYTVGGAYVTYAGDSYSAVANEYSGDIVIPATVTYNGYERKVLYVASNAFRDCINVTSVVIGDNITDIYSNAFNGCSNLKRVSFGKSLYNVYYDSFYGCNAITSVHYNCVYVDKVDICSSSVVEITFGDNVKSVSNFNGTGWYNEQPQGLLYLDNWLVGYKGDEPVGDIIIAEGTTHINEYALAYCKSITSVSIPESVEYIGDYFLRSCNGLISLKVAIDNPVFDSRENCNAIIETSTNTIIKACINSTIPNTVESIGAISFEELGLIEIEIPDNVYYIADGAFQSCI